MRATRRAWAAGPATALLALTVCAAALAAAAEQRTVRSEGEATVRALEAALLLSGQEGGVVRTAVVAVTAPLGDGRPGVQLLLEVDGARLPTEAAAGGRLDLFVYSLDPEGEVAASTSRRLRLEPAHQTALKAGGVRAALELPLSPGDYTLRILVRSGEGAFGVRSAPVTVPSADDGPRLLAPPLFPSAAEGWLLAAAPSAGPLFAAAAAAALPLPTALPVAGAGTTLEGATLVQALPASGASTLVAQLRQNATDDLHEVAIETVDRRATSYPGVESLRFRLPLTGLAAGLYTVRLALQLDGTTLTSPSGVIALSAAPRESRPWPAVELELLSAEPADPVRAAAPEVGDEAPLASSPATAAREAFTSARELLRAGDPDGARDRLEALHRSGPDAPGEMEPLQGAQWRQIVDFAESDAENGWDDLLPLLEVYADLASRYRLERRITLAEHATWLTGRLAIMYARRAGDPAAPERAAAQLERLAAAAMLAGDPTRAGAVYRAALRIDSDRPTALLGLGAVLEKQGRSGEAVAVLERLMKLRPEHPEGRLRLALALQRAGRADAAAALLEGLLDLSEPQWIAQLAHQELARRRLDAGAVAGAERLLRQAIQRWPSDPSPKILLAWLLDSVQRRGEADALLENVDRQASDGSPLPRYRYNDWPSESIAALTPVSATDETRATTAIQPGRR